MQRLLHGPRESAAARPRTLVAAQGNVWIWPGVALTLRRGSELVAASTETIRFWIARLHGPNALHTDAVHLIAEAARRLTRGDEEAAQRTLDAIGLDHLSTDGAALMRGVANRLGIEALDLPSRPSPRCWTAHDIESQVPFLARNFDRAAPLVKFGAFDPLKHPRWDPGAPDSQGGRFKDKDGSDAAVIPVGELTDKPPSKQPGATPNSSGGIKIEHPTAGQIWGNFATNAAEGIIQGAFDFLYHAGDWVKIEAGGHIEPAPQLFDPPSGWGAVEGRAVGPTMVVGVPFASLATRGSVAESAASTSVAAEVIPGIQSVKTVTQSVSTAEQLTAAAGRAIQKVGPGSGPAYGTAVHSALRQEILRLNNPNLRSEISYLNGEFALYGTRGSVRVDVVEGPVNAPTTVFDLKTGSATLTPSRVLQIQSHIPGGTNVPVMQIDPP